MAVDTFFGHDFNEAGVRIAGLVNVDIDQLIVFFGRITSGAGNCRESLLQLRM